MRHAIVDSITGKVLNVIEWDGVATFAAPKNTTLVRTNTAQIGDSYNPVLQTFAKETPPVSPPDSRIAILRASGFTTNQITALLQIIK